MEKLRYKNLWIIIGAFKVIFIYFICLMPMNESGPGIPYLDKIIHICIYIILCLWFILSFEFKYEKIIIFGLIFMGISIELLQIIVPTRGFDIFDIFANIGGCLLAFALTKLMKSNIFYKLESLFFKKNL